MNDKALISKALREGNIDTTFGKITSAVKIGEGGNGLVFSAKLNNIDVAIKFLVEKTNTKLDRFKAEYLNIKLINNNPFIVELIHYEEIKIGEKEYPAIFMKLYDDSLKRTEPDCHEKNNIYKLFEFLLNAVSFIHSQNIIHRDIKPQNILVKGDKYKLTDFGIAKFCPETFKFKANTKEGERLANYLFSAPEQMQGNQDKVNESSDIYAIGQVIHWYFFGETHRGTKRNRFSSINNELSVLDEVIDKCLSNNQEDRFKNCHEIKKFIEKTSEARKKENPWTGINSFARIIRKCFPKQPSGFFISKNQKIISRFFDLLIDNFKGRPVWFNGVSDSEIDHLTKINDETWLMNQYEIQVSKIFGFFDSSEHADIVFLTLKPMCPFGLDDIYEGKTEDHVAYLNKNIMISMNEYSNGFAEVNDDIIELTDENSEHRARYLRETTIAIATIKHSAYQIANDKYINSFISDIPENEGLLEEKIKSLIVKTRMNKDDEILMSM